MNPTTTNRLKIANEIIDYIAGQKNMSANVETLRSTINKKLKTTEANTVSAKLANAGFLNVTHNYSTYELTDKGFDILMRGGTFAYYEEAKMLKESLKEVKKSNKLMKQTLTWAIIIGIISVVTSVVIAIVH